MFPGYISSLSMSEISQTRNKRVNENPAKAPAWS